MHTCLEMVIYSQEGENLGDIWMLVQLTLSHHPQSVDSNFARRICRKVWDIFDVWRFNQLHGGI